MNEKTYATEFRSELKPTHKVTNTETNEALNKGTLSECLAFLSGVEHGNYSENSRNVVMRKLKEEN